MKAIEIEKLKKEYGSFLVLKGIDLDVNQGEIYGFLGPNGSGKTTTIRCLLDLIRPTSGQILVLGIDPQKEPVKVKQKVGYLPGELNLDESLTGKQCLQLFASLRSTGVDWNFVAELAEKLNLNLNTKIKNFSKGNKQKIGIVQAFMHKPELLILDEPTSGLDPLMQKQVLDMVRNAKKEGATVFFSSHILSEIEEVSHRVAIIRSGEIIDIVTTENLISKEMRCAIIEFKQDVEESNFRDISGVKKIVKISDKKIEVQMGQNLSKLIQAISRYDVVSFETTTPSLEEIFLNYYS